MASVRQVLQLLAMTYSSCVSRNPLLTNSITGFLIASTGDVICQKYEHNLNNNLYPKSSSSITTNLLPRHLRDTGETALKEVDAAPSFKINIKRTLDMGLIRALAVTPFVVNWYPMLYFFSPGKKIHNVMGRIAIDQSIGSPIVICLVFLSNSLLNFASFTSGIQRVLEHGFTTWTKGLCYWPFVHLLTFGVVPAVHQPLFGHVMSLYWNFVLSFYANKKKQ